MVLGGDVAREREDVPSPGKKGVEDSCSAGWDFSILWRRLFHS